MGFPLARLGYTYSYLAGKVEARGLFMSLSLAATYGIASYLVICLLVGISNNPVVRNLRQQARHRRHDAGAASVALTRPAELRLGIRSTSSSGNVGGFSTRSKLAQDPRVPITAACPQGVNNGSREPRF